MTNQEDAKTLADRGWFGWGRWDAPYWFIGPEPGGNDDHVSYDAWIRLGGMELVDCRQHHLSSNNLRWHDVGHPRAQPTWNDLIRLILSFKGGPADDLDAVKSYQQGEWGAQSGDTALIYLSARPAQTLRTDVDRKTRRDQRVDTIGQRLAENRPEIVVFYTVTHGYPPLYEKIARATFDEGGYGRSGSTLCVLMPNPARRSKSEFIEKGREIRGRTRAVR